MKLSFALKVSIALLFILHRLDLAAYQSDRDPQIIGYVVTEDRLPVEVGNIMLLSSMDTSFLDGALFVDGRIQFESLPSEDFMVKITALGFHDHMQRISPTTTPLDLGEIVLEYDLIEGVEVVAQGTLIEQTGTDLTVHVANTSLSNAGTALDILQNTPKVLVKPTGISLLGKGSAMIFVDGQLIASNDLLGSIPSTNIKEIKVMENPPAKFDASGNAIINIITKKKSLNGYKAGLNQEAGIGKYFRSRIQGNAYYKVDKLMLQVDGGIRPWTWGGRNHQDRILLDSDKSYFATNRFTQKNKRLDHNFSLKTNYQISSRIKLGIGYQLNKINGEKNAKNLRGFSVNDQNRFNIESDLDGPYTQNSHTANAFSTIDLDTLGSNLNFSGQYSNFNFDRTETIAQDYTQGTIQREINRSSNNQNKIDIYTAQMDWTKNFKQGGSFTSGVKFVQINNESNILLREGLDGEGVRLPEFSMITSTRSRSSPLMDNLPGQER